MYPNNNQCVRPKSPNIQGPSFQGPRPRFKIPIRPKTVPDKQGILPTPGHNALSSHITLTSGDHLTNELSKKPIQNQQQNADATLLKPDLDDLPHIRRRELDKIEFNLLELYYHIYKDIIETLDTSSVDKVKLQAKKEELQCIREVYKKRLLQPGLFIEDKKNSLREDIPLQCCETVSFQKLKSYSTKLNRLQAVNKKTLKSKHFNKLCCQVQHIYVKRLRKENPSSQKKISSLEKKNQSLQTQSVSESTSLLLVAAEVIGRLIQAKNKLQTQTKSRSIEIKTEVGAGEISTFKEAKKSVVSLKSAQINYQQVKTAKVQEVLGTQSETAVDSLKSAPVDCPQEKTIKVERVLGTQSKIAVDSLKSAPVDCQQEKTIKVEKVLGTQSKIAVDSLKSAPVDCQQEKTIKVEKVLGTQSKIAVDSLTSAPVDCKQEKTIKVERVLGTQSKIAVDSLKSAPVDCKQEKTTKVDGVFGTQSKIAKAIADVIKANKEAEILARELESVPEDSSDIEPILSSEFYKVELVKLNKFIRQSNNDFFKKQIPLQYRPKIIGKAENVLENRISIEKKVQICNLFEAAIKQGSTQVSIQDQTYFKELKNFFCYDFAVPDLDNLKAFIHEISKGEFNDTEVIEAVQKTKSNYWEGIEKNKKRSRFKIFKDTFNTATDYLRQLKTTKSQEEVSGTKKRAEVTDNLKTIYLRKLNASKSQEEVCSTKKSDEVIDYFNTAITNLQQLTSTVDIYGTNKSEPVIESLKTAIVKLQQSETTESQKKNKNNNEGNLKLQQSKTTESQKKTKRKKKRAGKTLKNRQVNKQNTLTLINMANPRPLIDVAYEQIFNVPQQQPRLYVPNQQPRVNVPQQQPFLNPTSPNVPGNRPSVDSPKRSLISGQQPKLNLMNQQPAMNTNMATKRTLYGPKGLQFYPSRPKGIPRSFYAKLNDTPMFPQTCGQVDLSPVVPNTPMLLQTDQQTSEMPQTYSPTDMYYADPQGQENREDSQSPSQETEGEGGERVSAFRRLGPAAKKPRLTINLLFSKENAVREVIDLDLLPEPYVPVWERNDVLSSTDDTVVRFLPYWPWKRVIGLKKTVVPRSSKSVMIMELEQMEEAYDSNNQFIKISVKDYPPTFKKEDVLDTLIETVKGKNFIPLFIEFTPEGCCFLVLRSRSALNVFHQNGLVIQKAGVKMPLAISITDLSLSHIDFIPRIILRKRLMIAHDENEAKLDLKEFCLGSDISNFIYFPLHFINNQTLLTQLAMSCISWNQLRSLDLSGNKLRTIDGFDLASTAPKLKHLDLSNNYFEKMTSLLPCRGLLLKSLKLEGNPLCLDYIDPVHYIKVAKMMFPTLYEIDSVEIPRKGSLPSNRGNYCPFDYAANAWSCIQILTPLWSSMSRQHMLPLYHAQSMLSVTYDPALRYTPTYRIFRSLFSLPRDASEREIGRVTGGSNIIKQLVKWPPFHVDPYNTLVDVMFSNEHSLILRICGVFKMTVDTLAENEPLLHYTRTLVISADPKEWHIDNEMIYWAQPTTQCANNAFSITTVEPPLQLSLKLESPPDEELKDNLISIFMNVTKLNKRRSERCLDLKDWDIKAALEHFMKLLKLNTLLSLDTQEGQNYII